MLSTRRRSPSKSARPLSRRREKMKPKRNRNLKTYHQVTSSPSKTPMQSHMPTTSSWLTVLSMVWLGSSISTALIRSTVSWTEDSAPTSSKWLWTPKTQLSSSWPSSNSLSQPTLSTPTATSRNSTDRSANCFSTRTGRITSKSAPESAARSSSPSPSTCPASHRERPAETATMSASAVVVLHLSS